MQMDANINSTYIFLKNISNMQPIVIMATTTPLDPLHEYYRAISRHLFSGDPYSVV